MIFNFRIIETITVEKDYVVEASDVEEAKSYALSGETIAEKPLRELEVINREIISVQ